MNGTKLVSAVIVAVALCVSTAKVNAMTVNWSANGNTAIALNNGVDGVPVGDQVYLGIFKNNLSNAAITALWTGNANAATDILNAFTIWNQDVMGNGGVGVGGFGAVNNINPGNNMFNSNAFLIVVNNATGPGGVSQIGVWNTAMLFPSTDTASPGSFDTDSLIAGDTLVGNYIASGWQNGNYDWFSQGANELVLANIVPEPSTYMLVAMGLLGAWGLRRRRS